jgi:hypothetical protein
MINKLIIHANLMSYLSVDFVIPACPESFFQKDSRQAGVTAREKDIK